MQAHLRRTKGYNPTDKMTETLSLSVFATNVLSTAKQKGIKIDPTFKAAGLRPQMLYEMKEAKFYRFVNSYTLIRISNLVGEPIWRLYMPTEEQLKQKELISLNSSNDLSQCLKMNQQQYSKYRGVSPEYVCQVIKKALLRNDLSSLPGVVHIDKFAARQYVLYVKP